MDICSCTKDEIENLNEPLFRLICHCSTCRSYTGADFFDECTFLLKDSESLSLDKVDFKTYQSGFSPMKRGRCNECGKVSYSTIRVWPFPKFVMLPTAAIRNKNIKKPFAHLYYKSRVIDIDDSVRKINSHFVSQLFIQFNIIRSLLARRFK